MDYNREICRLMGELVKEVRKGRQTLEGIEKALVHGDRKTPAHWIIEANGDYAYCSRCHSGYSLASRGCIDGDIDDDLPDVCPVCGEEMIGDAEIA